MCERGREIQREKTDPNELSRRQREGPGREEGSSVVAPTVSTVGLLRVSSATATAITAAARIGDCIRARDLQVSGHFSAVHMSDDHMSDDHISDDHISDDHISDDHMRDDHISDDHISDDHISDDHISDDHIGDATHQ